MDNNNDQHAGKWCWHAGDAEDFQGSCASEAEAHAEARGHMDDEVAPGIVVKYSIARVVHPLDLISDRMMKHHIEQLVDGMCETAADECGGDDAPLVISEVEVANLAGIVKTFLRAYASIQRHGVKDEVVHDYVVGVTQQPGSAP